MPILFHPGTLALYDFFLYTYASLFVVAAIYVLLSVPKWSSLNLSVILEKWMKL